MNAPDSTTGTRLNHLRSSRRLQACVTVGITAMLLATPFSTDVPPPPYYWSAAVGLVAFCALNFLEVHATVRRHVTQTLGTDVEEARNRRRWAMTRIGVLALAAVLMGVNAAPGFSLLALGLPVLVTVLQLVLAAPKSKRATPS